MGELGMVLDKVRVRLKVPAMVGAVVDRDGGLEIDVAGLTKRGAGAEPVTVDDHWHLGSCGRALTAVLCARLVEVGLVAWTAPVGALFGDLAEVHEAWYGPTLDDLLWCRAGVVANPGRSQYEALWRSPLPPVEQRTEAARSVLARSPRHRPGRFWYSNLSYVIAGAAIDRIAGMPFEDAMRVHVLEPLGIGSLGYGPPPRVWGHHPRFQWRSLVLGRDGPADPSDPRSDSPVLLSPAGRMHLSVPDWARFHQLFLKRGAPLLRAETIEHLLEIPPGGRRSMAMGWTPAAMDAASYGMLGSNTLWAATALMSADMSRTAMVIANDGRTRVVQRCAVLALDLLNRYPRGVVTDR